MSAQTVSLLQKLSIVFNILVHQILAVLIVYIFTIVFQNLEPNSLTTWHMILTPFGFLVLMAEGLVLYAKDNAYTSYLPRNSKHSIHSLLQVLGAIFITIGIAFKIHTSNSPHFHSVHGKLGLSSLVFVWCSIFLGVATGQSQSLKNLIKPAWLKLIHTLIGVATFTLGVCCIGYAFKGHIFENYSQEGLVVAAIVAMAIAYCGVILDSCTSIVNSVKNIF